MPKIHQLSQHEIQKIAAGEVVERPVSVVKELVENALDADATQLKIMIEDGGRKLIRVIDNGYGMDVADAHACFMHHATSKIRSVDDLIQLQTFGFRGEALSSIASVSKITLITREKDAEESLKVELEAADEKSDEQVAANVGTDIAVRDLFFNIPARRKFLKMRETEWRQIMHFVQAMVLAYPGVHIELFNDGNLVLNCPGNDSLQARCAQLWDYNLAQQMLPLSINNTSRGIAIKGIVSRQQCARYDRSGIFIFVNRRWIKNHHLVRALLKGYQNSLPPARYPMAALFITIDTAELDINIHPRKEEVKFFHPIIVESLINQGVQQSLAQQLSNNNKVTEDDSVVQLPSEEPFVPSHARPPDTIWMAQKPQKEIFQPNISKKMLEKQIVQEEVQHASSEANEHPLLADEQVSVVSSPSYIIIGQYHKTYILLEQVQGLLLIDQHAAHERILYELFAQRFHDVAVVPLIFPTIITMTRDDAELAERYNVLFHAHGLMIERFGEQQVRLTATPVHLQKANPHELIKQIIGWIREYDAVDEQEMQKLLNDKVRAKMACVAAIKAGDVMSLEQMNNLIQELYKTDNRITCPHGRPTSWLIDHHELEKKFKRDYRSSMRLFD